MSFDKKYSQLTPIGSKPDNADLFAFLDASGTILLSVRYDNLGFLEKTGGTMSGAIAMGTSKITGLGDPTADQDAATKKYVDDNLLLQNQIGELADVTIATPADNEVLAFNTGTGEWINQTPTEAGLAALVHTHVKADITDFAHTHVKADITDFPIVTADITDANVTYAKIQNVSATDKILGRDTAGAGVIEEITPANLLTMLGVEAGATADQTDAEIKTAYENNANTNEFSDAEQTKLAGIATGANLYVHPNHTGDVTSIADGATTIAVDAVDIAMLSASGTPDGTTFLRGDNVWAAPSGGGDMVLAGIQIVTGAKTFGTIGGAVGKFILAGSTSGSTIVNAAAVAGSTTITFPGTTGTVSLVGHSHVKADITDFPIVTVDISNDNVTFAKTQNIATSRILGRVTAATGDIEELTGTQATTLLDNFTSTLKGLAPLSGGGTTNFLRADGTWAAPPGGGSQTPWTSDIDADGFDLNDLSNIEFRATTGAPAGTVYTVYRDTNALTMNVSSAGTIDFSVNNSNVLQLSAGFMSFSGIMSINNQEMRNAQYLSQNGIEATTGFVRIINTAAVNWRNAGNTADFGITGNASDQIEFDAPIAFGTNQQFYGTNQNMLPDAGGFTWNLPTGDLYEYTINASVEMQLTAAALVLGAGNNILMSASAGLGYLEQGALTTPATPANGFGRYYVKEVATVTTPFFIGDDGTEIDLTAGGGSQTPWTSTIDAADNLLENVSAIEFNSTSGAPASSLASIYYDSADGLNIRAPVGKFILFEISGVSWYNMNGTEATFTKPLNMNSGYIHNLGNTTDSSTGALRLGNTSLIGWRNAGNTADLGILFDASDEFTFNGTTEIFGPKIISNHATVTAVAGDFVLVLDATDTTVKKVNASDFLGAASQTPWTSDIDADGFDLKDISNIEFRDTTAKPAGTVPSIYSDSAGRMHINVPSGELIEFDINDVIEYQFNSTSANFTFAEIFQISQIRNINDYIEQTGIAPATGFLRMINNQSINWRNAGDTANFGITGNANDNIAVDTTIELTGAIEFSDATIPAGTVAYIMSDALDMGFNVPTGNRFEWRINGVDEMRLSNSSLQLSGNYISEVSSIRANASPIALNKFINMANAQEISWRNIGNSADLGITVNASDEFVFGSTSEIFGANIITNHATVTAVSGDFVLIHDATDGTVKKADALDFLGGGSQTPWVADIDADGFDLTDLSNIEFRTTTGAPGVGVQAIWADAGGININLPTSDTLDIQINGVSVANFGSILHNMTNKILNNVSSIRMQTNPASDGFVRMSVGQQIGWRNQANNEDLFLQTNTSDEFEFQINGTIEMILSATTLDLQANTITDIGGITVNAGGKISVDSDATEAGFFDAGHTADPSSATAGDMYFNTTSNEYRSYNGTTWDVMKAGSGSQTPWLSDIDADNFNLFDIERLEFDAAGALGATTVQYIVGDAGGLNYNVPSGDVHDFRINGTVEVSINSGGLNMNSGLITTIQAISATGSTSTGGFVRMGNNTSMNWRNAANSANFGITGNASDNIEIDTDVVLTVGAPLIGFIGTDYNLGRSGSSLRVVTAGVTRMQFGTFVNLSANDIEMSASRFLEAKGADVASPAGGILTLGGDGNIFDITGTNTINEILPTSWEAGSTISLQFDGILTVTHNSGGTNDILLGDQTNMTTAAGDVLTLFYNGIDWVEISRSVIGAGGSQTPWTSDIDADGFDLTDLSNIEFRNTTGAPGGATPAIWYASSTFMRFNVPVGDNFQFQFNGTSVIEMAATYVNLSGKELRGIGGSTDASTGGIQISNNIAVNWRNAANSADFGITGNASDNIAIDTNLDMQTNLILDSGRHEFNTSGGLGAAGDLWITGNTDLSYNTVGGGAHNFLIGGQSRGRVTNDGFDARGFSLINLGSQSVSANTGRIRMTNADTIAWRNAGNSADIGFSVNASDQFLWGADHDLDGFDLKDISNLEFRNTTGQPASSTPYIAETAAQMVFNVPVSGGFDFTANGVTSLKIQPDGDLQMKAGANVLVLASGASGYVQVSAITTPATPPNGIGRYYTKEVSTITTPFFIGDDGVEIDLTAGGGSQTPWTQDIDADGFDLNDLSNIEFRDPSTGLPAGTVYYIGVDAAGMQFNIPTGNQFEWSINGGEEMRLTGGQLVLQGVDLNMNGTEVINIRGLVSSDDAHQWDMARQTAQADDYTIGELRFRHNDALGAQQNYARIIGVMENDVDPEDGSLHIFVTEAGVHDVEYLSFNDAAGGQIRSTKDIRTTVGSFIADLSGQGIEFINSQYIHGDTGGLDFNVTASDTYDFRVNTVLQFSISDAAINIQGNTLSSGVVDGTITGVSGITGLGIQSQNMNFNSNALLNVQQVQASGIEASAGFIRMQNNQAVNWRNAGNTADFGFLGSTSDEVELNGAALVLEDNGLKLENPAGTFEYLFQTTAIVADRTITIPLLTGNDDLVLEDFAQTLTNKTIDGDLNTILDINETQMNVSVGASGTVLTSNGVGVAPTYQTAPGSQTPWTSDIDADGFDLRDLSNIEFRNSTGIPAGSVTSMYADSTSLNWNVASGLFQWFVGGFLEYEFRTDASGFTMNANNVTGLGNLGFDITGQSINSNTGGLEYNVDASDTHEFFINTISAMILSATSLDMQANAIIDSGSITLNAGSQVNVDTDATNSGFADAGHTADPSANTAGDMYYNTTANEYRFYNGTGWISMDGSGGGSQTPWAQDVDADGFDLNDLSNIEFRDTTGTPAGSVPAIFVELGTMNLNVATGESFFLNINGINEYSLSATQFDMQANILQDVNRVDFNQTGTLGATSESYIVADAGGFTYNIPNSDVYDFRIGGISAISISSTQLDLFANTLNWSTDGHSISVNATQFNINASIVTDTIQLRTGGSNRLQVNNTGIIAGGQLNMASQQIFGATNITINAGGKMSVDSDATEAGFFDAGHTADPSSATAGDMYFNTTANEYRSYNGTTWDVMKSGGGSEVFTWTADHDAAGFDLLNVGGIQINNPADTFQYIITPAAIAADRILNLPLMTGTDTVVLNDFAATLTNKTITAAANTLTIASTDLTDTAVIVLNNQVNTYAAGNTQNFVGNASNSPVNIGELSADPSALTDGDFWLTASGVLRFRTTGATRDVLTNNTGATVTFKVFAGTGANEFEDNGLVIQNPADTFNYTFQSSAIVAARTITIPLLTGNDDLVLEDFIQTLTNKTLTTPTIGSFVNATHDHQAAADGGTLLSTSALSDTADIAYLNTANTFIAGNKNTFAHDATNSGIAVLPVAGNPSSLVNGDIWLNSSTNQLFARINGVSIDLGQSGGEVLTWTADHDAAGFDLLNVGGIQINNPADTFQYVITPAAIVADRIVNLPLMTGTDALVLNDFAATLTNKTMTLGSNTITGTRAQFDIAVTDANIMYIGDAPTAHSHLAADLPATIVYNDQTNVFGDFDQDFKDNRVRIFNPADTFAYTIIASAIAAARNVTIPLLLGNDIFVTEAFIQTLTNKTIDLGTNTLTGTVAEFNTALQSETFAYIGVANAWGTADQNIAATGKWQEGGVDISPIGIHDIPMSAVSFFLPTLEPATGLTNINFATNDLDKKVFDFTSTAADERIQAQLPALPRNWNESTVDIEITWSFGSGSGVVRWGARFAASGDNEAIDAAFGTATLVNDTAGTANQTQKIVLSGVVMPSGIAAADELQLEIFREGSNAGDTFTGVARFHGAVVRITTNTAVAA